MVLKKGIQKAVDVLVEELQAVSKKVETKEAKAQVASISAADEEIGGLIADAMEKVGDDGVITVEESKTMETCLELLKVCNLTAVIFLLIWQQILIKWKQFLTTRSYSSQTVKLL